MIQKKLIIGENSDYYFIIEDDLIYLNNEHDDMLLALDLDDWNDLDKEIRGTIKPKANKKKEK